MVTGVAVFSRPVAAAAAPVAAAEESGVVTSPSDRRPAMGDKVTISAQPRNTDFLQPGQVGTVVEVDDMDAEDVWFTVEDADGETDEYCEADLVLAAAVGASPPPSAALAASTGPAAVGASPPLAADPHDLAEPSPPPAPLPEPEPEPSLPPEYTPAVIEALALAAAKIEGLSAHIAGSYCEAKLRESARELAEEIEVSRAIAEEERLEAGILAETRSLLVLQAQRHELELPREYPALKNLTQCA